MPLYEYRCDACNHQFEVIQKFSDALVGVCPSCGGGPVAKLLSSPAIQFKGSGWYITDYARKDQARSGKPGESSRSGESSTTDGSANTAESGKSGESKTSESSSTSTTATPSSAPAPTAAADRKSTA